ncbi:SH2 domain containing adapter protein E [Dissostichus eleginoides]|uniref:SH2 domain containing adapter protein E n=1 Tax=Dissostichus eleginoides TaxID=100907 RepID=A0AAD9FAP8_DISEL|nr:SH2 domain containing adapter protein E [Dissostichus eleginoides]
MAKWFRDFPINLKNGNERVRSASESGPQTRLKPSFSRDSLKGNQRKDGGVGGLLAGRNRKNSAIDLGRNNAGFSGAVWDSLTQGKGRKNSKVESGAPDENRQVRTSSLAHAYISRMIKVDKQDKTPKLNGISEQKQPEEEKGRSDIKTTLIILEDYADPFDAEKTKEQREAERAGVNDGYMEPYDAQVIITEVRRRGSKDLLKVCVLLDRGKREGKGEEGKPSPPNNYDTPYEGGLESDGGGVWIPVTRPESDVRPAGEYELPWEWRKEDIVRALSAQFEAVDCSPTKEDGSPSARQQQQTLSLNKLSPPSPTSPTAPLDGEAAKVDPSLPLEKQSVSRQQAEAQLQRCREASFLVRDSESGTSKYSIALKTSQSCVHIIVAQTKSAKGLGFTLDQSSCVFSSIPELVHRYCTHRLPFTGAEHMTLQHPVPRPH